MQNDSVFFVCNIKPLDNVELIFNRYKKQYIFQHLKNPGSR